MSKVGIVCLVTGFFLDDWYVPERFYGDEIDRLAAYENTGLEPKEIVELKARTEVAVQMKTSDVKREPLTLDQLRKMDGKPAYWLEDESYGIISVDSNGKWAGIPFFRGRKNGVNFKYDIESRGMEIYSIEHTCIDRDKWDRCGKCKSCENCINEADYNPYEGEYGECGNCYQMSNFEPKKFCHECGRPLTEEAWTELERRIFGE